MSVKVRRADRVAAGAMLRSKAAPADIAAWRPAPDRPDPVALLEEQAVTRMPELVPIRYGRMSAGPFPFLRGAALPMAADLATVPVTGMLVQLCGDAHLCNFGLYASPERDLVFDVNDFDETHAGPWEWDLLRLAASLAVAARSRGFTAHDGRHAIRAAVRAYRERMHEFAAMRAIDRYYAKVDAASILSFVDDKARPYLDATIKSATHHDALHELPKITTGEGEAIRIVDRPPVITHPPALAGVDLSEPFARYAETLQEDRRDLFGRYQLVDVALKVVGVGSVGLGAWVALMLGEDAGDPLFLQVKEAQASVLEQYTAIQDPDHQGERVVQGQRRLQAASDVLLGWMTGAQGRHLYVRQLQDQKGSPVIEAMDPDDLIAWAALCGWALARGHAQTGDASMLAGYLGDDDEVTDAVTSFAATYADQTERDHAALVRAIASGRIAAETGI